MNRLVWLGLLLGVGAVLVGGCRDNQYLRCGAFEFDPLKLVDEDADPLDCGQQRIELELSGHEALDCALQALADGQALRVEIEREPRADAVEIRAELFADEDGLAMLWQDVNEDLNGFVEAKVVQLDVERAIGCRDVEDAGERYRCFDGALEAAELVDTCERRAWVSQ